MTKLFNLWKGQMVSPIYLLVTVPPDALTAQCANDNVYLELTKI